VFFNILGRESEKFLDLLGDQLMQLKGVEVVNDEAVGYLDRLADG
jgi:hypothetical protein